jgi:hypothetical protein
MQNHGGGGCLLGEKDTTGIRIKRDMRDWGLEIMMIPLNRDFRQGILGSESVY